MHNPWPLLLLLVLLASLAVEALRVALSLKALEPRLPEEFKGWYDPDEYARSQRYTRSRELLGLLEGAVGLAVLLGFILAGGIAWLDGLARSLTPGAIAAGVLFIGGLALAGDLLSLPFAVYRTFGLEERYGFNRTTPTEFIKDRLKGWTLAVVLLAPLLGAVLWFFQHYGQWAWLLAWGAVTMFMLVLQYLAPSLLLPLFNKFKPLEQGELRERIEAFAREQGFELSGIYVMDGSRRSTKANAFFTGFGRRRRIALFDTLLQRHPPEEIVAVLAHEVGHCKKRHVPALTALAVAKTGLLFLLLSQLLGADSLFAAFDVPPSTHVGLVLFGLLFTPASLLLSLPANWLSRRFEYQADAFAVRGTGQGETLIQALKRLVTQSLGNVTPHPLDVALHYSHPPVLERIRHIRHVGQGGRPGPGKERPLPA